jgi:outer membrane biosynthesis protein TonB
VLAKASRSLSTGSLDVPTPLPDDDTAAQEPSDRPAEPQPSNKTHPNPKRQPQRSPTAVQEPSTDPALPRRPAGGGRPPGTIRVSEHAAAKLWQAYLIAKQADPLLSYQQFASGVVLTELIPGRLEAL